MADDFGDDIPSSSLDKKVDSTIVPQSIHDEKYKNDVAGTHVKTAALRDIGTKSETMAEIERQVQSDVLGTKNNQKLGTFGLAMSRKSDFRLKDLTRRLEQQLRTDFAKEIKTGPASNRIRDFDVRSQSMRMIAANAALGSYQFQKNQVLPYMRKDLALSYEKVDLLKKVVGGVGSLEKALVTKLEAIKMNTAAVVPKKKSYIGTVMAEVKKKNIDRIAGNISNLVMDRYDEQYTRIVSPVLARLNKIMHDPSSTTGGLNGVNRAVTQKLNNLRHATARMGSRDTSAMGFLGTLQTGAAKVATGALGTGIKMTQGRKLSDGTNAFLSGQLKSYTTFMDKLHPFGRLDRKADSSGDINLVTPPTLTDMAVTPSMDRLTRLFQDWRMEYRRDTDHLISDINAIRLSIAPVKALPAPKPNGLPPQINAAVRATPHVTVASVKSSLASKIPSVKMPNVKMPSVSFPSMPRIAAPSIKLPQLSTAPLHHIAQKASDTQDMVFGGLGALIGTLTAKLSTIDTTLRKSDKDRTAFEKSETKRESLLDKLAAKARIRKDSYEDIESKRAGAGALAGLMSLLPMARGSAGSAGAQAAGAAGSAGAAASGTGITGTLLGLLGGGLLGIGKGAAKLGWKGTKLGAKYGLKGARKAVPFAARTGLKGLWNLTKLGTKGAFGAGKITARLGAKGALGAAKLGAGGLFKFAKSGFGVGLAAGIGDHYLQKSNASSETKRVGGTALEMASWGATGAEVGSLFGGVGAVPGALIGAGIGAVVANADYAAKALHAIGHGAIGVAGSLITGIFGQSAIVRPDGTVERQEKSNIFGNIKSFFFGQDAKYSRSGEVISPTKLSLFGKIQYGFQKTLFGDKYDNGEYKEGTSLIDELRSGISKTLSAFGKEIMALPGQVKRGLTSMVSTAEKAAKYTKDKVVAGAVSAEGYIANKASQARVKVSNGINRTKDLYQHFTLQKAESFAGDIGTTMLTYSPIGFALGASSAAFGWNIESGALNNPSSPYYNYVSQVLSAYGVKDRSQYRFLHSTETSQTKINAGQTKPFDDNDMAFMASRYGFDPKNKDQVNYFKLWYKRRFIPALALITKVLQGYKLTIDSALSADEKQIGAITEALKKEIMSSDLSTAGLEPSVAAYNKYAKIGSSDPGGKMGGNASKVSPFDPRDPRNRNSAGAGGPQDSANSQRLAAYMNPRNLGMNGPLYDSSPYGPADRKSASMVKGGVRDQPEFKAAYQKLPTDVKKGVDKSPALQFALWSTAVQHGPDNAVKIFMQDYSGSLDDKANLRKIYQDRSTKFEDLNSNDRSEAISHLGSEEQFAESIVGGAAPSMAAMGRQVTNLLGAAGNSNASGFNSSNIRPLSVTGSVSSRAKDAVNYLMSKKWSKNAAMGIVANLMQESALMTNRPGDSGAAYGIAQWHKDRAGPIAKQFGKPLQAMNFHEQLDAVDWEMRGGGAGGVHKDFAAMLNSAKDPGEAAVDVMQKFERPADHATNGPNARARAGMALGLAKTLGTDTGTKDTTAPGSPPPVASSSSTAASPSSPPATKTASRPAATPSAPAPAPAAPDNSQHIQNNTAAMQANTAALQSQKQNGGGTTLVHAPTTNNNQNSGGVAGWLSMAMSKAQVAVGEL